MERLSNEVTGLVTGEHALLRKVLEGVATYVGGGDWAEADLNLAAFARHLRSHMALERDLIYRPYLAAPGADEDRSRRAAEMLGDHEEIERGLGELERAVAQRDESGGVDGCVALAAVIRDHEAREELVVLPACEVLFGPDQRRALVEAFEG